jgi:hypothetical protein
MLPRWVPSALRAHLVAVLFSWNRCAAGLNEHGPSAVSDSNRGWWYTWVAGRPEGGLVARWGSDDTIRICEQLNLTNGCCQAARPLATRCRGWKGMCYLWSTLRPAGGHTHLDAGAAPAWSLANSSYCICRLIDFACQHWFRFDSGLGRLSPVSWCCPSDLHECMTRGLQLQLQLWW